MEMSRPYVIGIGLCKAACVKMQANIRYLLETTQFYVLMTNVIGLLFEKHIRRDFDRSQFGLVRFGSEP